MYLAAIADSQPPPSPMYAQVKVVVLLARIHKDHLSNTNFDRITGVPMFL